jgi:hypothetical protein
MTGFDAVEEQARGLDEREDRIERMAMRRYRDGVVGGIDIVVSPRTSI